MPLTDVDKYQFIDNYIWISTLGDEGLYFVIPTWPEQIQDNMRSTFNSENALSRSAPVWSYENSGPRSIRIRLDLHREMLDIVNINNDTIQKYKDTLKENSFDTMDTLIKAINSISVPKYTLSAKAVQPPVVAMKFGSEIYIKGIVNGTIDVNYQLPLIEYEDGKTRYAQVQIGFEVTEIDPYDALTLFQIGSFRNIVSTSYMATSTAAPQQATSTQTSAQVTGGFESNLKRSGVNKVVDIENSYILPPSRDGSRSFGAAGITESAISGGIRSAAPSLSNPYYNGQYGVSYTNTESGRDHWCTNYAYCRSMEIYGGPIDLFSGGYKNAYQWYDEAKWSKSPGNSDVRAGDIIVWDKYRGTEASTWSRGVNNSNYRSAGSIYGHVGIVEEVNKAAGTVSISEGNFSGGFHFQSGMRVTSTNPSSKGSKYNFILNDGVVGTIHNPHAGNLKTG